MSPTSPRYSSVQPDNTVDDPADHDPADDREDRKVLRGRLSEGAERSAVVSVTSERRTAVSTLTERTAWTGNEPRNVRDKPTREVGQINSAGMTVRTADG